MSKVLFLDRRAQSAVENLSHRVAAARLGVTVARVNRRRGLDRGHGTNGEHCMVRKTRLRLLPLSRY